MVKAERLAMIVDRRNTFVKLVLEVKFQLAITTGMLLGAEFFDRGRSATVNN